MAGGNTVPSGATRWRSAPARARANSSGSSDAAVSPVWGPLWNVSGAEEGVLQGGIMAVRGYKDWEEQYRAEESEELPWFYAPLDPDVLHALEARGLRRGKALDLGTGPGTQAIELAKLGFEVTGSDISATAIKRAKDRANSHGVAVTFLEDDLVDSRLVGPFKLVMDRGCFHAIELEQREGYLETLSRIVEPGGVLLLKCFSHKEPGDKGPRRLRPDELHTHFEPMFEVQSIDETVFQCNFEEWPRALFAQMIRL
ncbi:MAG: SAM-dependent methyltransferase [Deltaproteobacteria bacterium]|jgi:SAM-dependent methyltransferase|nr:SAM-dependent methyltransferase [Deltaproteobacteria bacterium]